MISETSPTVQGLRLNLPMYRVPVWSLVRKFRSHMLWGVRSNFFLSDTYYERMICTYTNIFEGKTWCTSGSVDQWFNWKRGTGRKGRKFCCLKFPVWLSVIFKTAGDHDLLSARIYSNLGWHMKVKYEANTFRQR